MTRLEQLQRRYKTRNETELLRRCTHTHAHTLWLTELMEDNDVVGVVEVFSQCLDVLTRQSVGHEDRSPVSVCPVDTILKHTENHRFMDFWGTSVKTATKQGFFNAPNVSLYVNVF